MAAQDITQEYLKSILEYNQETGIFTWKEREKTPGTGGNTFNTRFAGKEAGRIDKDGYIAIMIRKCPRRAHRLAYLYVYGYMPIEIDHEDSIRHHNWISNLRECSRGENNQNLKKATIANKSTGLLGAFLNKNSGSFYSQIKKDGNYTWLGCFKTPEQAHEAYVNAKRELHPFGTL